MAVSAKYPWHKLKKVGDTFVMDADPKNLHILAREWGKRHGMKLKAHKAKGGALVVRLA